MGRFKIYILPAVVVTLAIFLPMLFRQVHQYDNIVHLKVAEHFIVTGDIKTPHFLFQVLVTITHKIFALDLQSAGVVVMALSIVAATLLLFKGMADREVQPGWLSLFLVPALLIVGPVGALFWLDRHLYFGYIGINTFHNPTILVLKPFALAIFLLAGVFLSDAHEKSRRWVWCLPPLLVLSALAKPNFLVTFLPALTIFLVLRQWSGKPVEWKTFGFLILLPSLLVLGWQYAASYSDNQLQGVYQGRNAIEFAPLAVMKHWSGWLFPKFFLSCAFPLAVAIVCRATLWNDQRLLLAWLTFFFGVAQTYLFAETGPRRFEANFFWSGQIGLFLLFFASALHFFSGERPLRKRLLSAGGLVCAGTLVLHLAFGIAFYFGEYYSPERFW